MILVDISEPDDIVNLLRQTAPVEIMPLNQTGRSDYYFGGEDSRTRQFCRVQAGELLANIDSQEDELRRYYGSADENNMIIEGIISDVPLTRRHKDMETVSVRLDKRPSGVLFAYRVAPNGYLFGEHSFNVSSDLLYAWLYRLYDAGIQTFFAINYVMTAKCIASVYRNCQRPQEEHSTLNRYYTPRIVLSESQPGRKRATIREQNPFIRALMAFSLIYHLDIGEKKATALYEAGYKTVFDLAYASVKELTAVHGVGKTIATNLLNSIGGGEL